MRLNRTIWIAIVVIVLLGLGAFFVLGRQGGDTQEVTDTQETSLTQQTAAPTMAANDSTNSAQTGEVKEFTVEGSPFKYEPATLTVNEGDRVRVVFKNIQGMHDFVIDELNVKTQVLTTPNAEETVEFVASKKGTFKYYCSVPGHRAKGMEGTITVQ